MNIRSIGKALSIGASSRRPSSPWPFCTSSPRSRPRRSRPRPATSASRSDLPINNMQILPPVSPEAQPLPFMGTDARYAVCRFDTEEGAVALNATLPGPGWILALYSPEGDNFVLVGGAAWSPPRRVAAARPLRRAVPWRRQEKRPHHRHRRPKVAIRH